MQKTFRMILRGRKGRCLENFRSPEITTSSVIHISVSEAFLLDQALTPEALIGSRFVAAADISVRNISPSNGRVDFVIFVEWGEPLNIVIDITILDPPVVTILGV
jgi:hypothetical protein